MSARYTQSKAETAKHLDILKGMLKRPENKLCADCKKNDPRWASTNLGCFMCIRCSGVHRGMGVHITRIKSVDLDTWSAEQIENVQRWGNARANAYWEAHLKPGHQPPEHKIESFIRSKYESRRWAMEGPIPDPETLDGASAPAPTPTATAAAPAPASRPSSAAPPRKAAPSSAIDLLAGPPGGSASRSAAAQPRAAAAAPAAAPAPAPAAAPSGGGLFDLDFNAQPTAAQPAAAKRDAKADILSLFASAPPPRPQAQQQQSGGGQQAFGGFQQQPQQQAQAGGFGGLQQGMGGLNLGGGGASDPWGQPQSAPQGGANSFADFGSFGAAPTQNHQPKPAAADPFASFTAAGGANVWGTPAAQPAPASNDPFGSFSSGGGAAAPKKGSEFSSIWD